MTSPNMVGSYQSGLVPVAGLSIALLMGCGDSSPSKSKARSSAVTVPIISGDELASKVEQSCRPVVVEVGVPMGCFRCNDMRPQYDQLADTFSEEINFFRVDFNASANIASQYGATICPSYVVFSNGEPVACYRYPTSMDLLASKLGESVHAFTSSAPSSSDQEDAL
ncbi:MAG: thioredoxin family protein [Planctomycetaceae bacterium]|nr:thioredoxin family protein [Planctomycetaceae bacterium]